MCLHGFPDNDKLQKHIAGCVYNQRTTLPNKEKKLLKFSTLGNSATVPFMIACDFESIQPQITENNHNSDNRDYKFN